jgi:hypothetical protein
MNMEVYMKCALVKMFICDCNWCVFSAKFCEGFVVRN